MTDDNFRRCYFHIFAAGIDAILMKRLKNRTIGLRVGTRQCKEHAYFCITLSKDLYCLITLERRDDKSSAINLWVWWYREHLSNDLWDLDLTSDLDDCLFELFSLLFREIRFYYHRYALDKLLCLWRENIAFIVLVHVQWNLNETGYIQHRQQRQFTWTKFVPGRRFLISFMRATFCASSNFISFTVNEVCTLLGATSSSS